ncbi:hypothetical protein CTRI78_v010436 [Colletotrichum trifolii]|uniref:Extracellular membrane protein CFEM domain-containing protein n=1 Tax=Colletotrichum trifolii TaxID=5466 RepID=A0A4R8QLM5_COLTR|nr:hypothetical protein CTRI78_v010436 [Colletotrichum trifolii]
MAPSRRKASSLLSILLLATPALAKYQNDFSLYPSAAQPCLYAASDNSQCDGDTVPEMNKCLCSDSRGKFVTNAAQCLGKQAKDTLRTVYQSLSTACSDSKSPVAVTEDQFIQLGAVGATASLSITPSASATSRTSTPTTFMTTTTGGATVIVTSTPGPTQTSDADDSTGLSTTAKIGIGVGSGVGAVALVGLIAFVWRLKRSRDSHDESRPMLGGGIGATGYNPHNSPPSSVATFGGAYHPHEYKADNKPAGWRPVSEISPGPSPGGQSWATTSPQPPFAQTQHSQYSPPHQQQQQQHAWGHHPQAAYVPSPQQQQPGVFELASMPVQASQPPPDAVEMPATEVQPQPARYQYPSQR